MKYQEVLNKTRSLETILASEPYKIDQGVLMKIIHGKVEKK